MDRRNERDKIEIRLVEQEEIWWEDKNMCLNSQQHSRKYSRANGWWKKEEDMYQEHIRGEMEE